MNREARHRDAGDLALEADPEAQDVETIVRLRVDLDDPASGPARPSASAARTSSIAQRGGVQVNIGRVEVVRQADPAPAAARPAAPPRPDPAAGHAAYLARRWELS